MLAGWSSGSKYPLLGSVRASAQMVSYEAALGLSVATVVLVTGTLTTSGIVVEPGRPVPAGTWSPPASCRSSIFIIAGTAELNRPPFDLVEAEQELVGGFHTEYSSHPVRALLPGRVHEHGHDVGHHRHAVPRWPAAAVRHPAHPAGAREHPVVLRQAVRLPVRLRLVPGHAAPVPLRPADGPRLEGADPARLRLVPAASPRCGWPTTRTGTGVLVAAVAIVVAVGRASACCCLRLRVSCRGSREPAKGRCSDGLPQGLPRHAAPDPASRSPRRTRAASRATART